jgi:hypothetical protein
MLTAAWAEAVEQRRLGVEVEGVRDTVHTLRKLASSLEVHAVLNPDLPTDEKQACAFVAAEALDVALQVELDYENVPTPWLFGTTRNFEQIETALLYMTAGYDANAGRSVATLEPDALSEMTGTEKALLIDLLAFLRLEPVSDVDLSVDDGPGDLSTQRIARDRLLNLIRNSVINHSHWLSFREDEWHAVEDLTALLELLDSGASGDPSPARHADIYHLAVLLSEAFRATHTRALRQVAPPSEDDGIFQNYQERQSQTRPLLWPAALEYAEKCLPGPSAHAVVNVPTGAGKSAVADLAVAQALSQGWVLYLAPTNALVAQIRRQLGKSFGSISGVSLRQFQGGAEYTGASSDDLGRIISHQILVMTPEKCSLMLRQSPDVFADLALCVVDEAHSLGEPGARAAILELVIAETMLWAPNAKVILLSALLANADEMASWLAAVSEFPAQSVTSSWRPTRTLRSLAGFITQSTQAGARQAQNDLALLPKHRKKLVFGGEIGLLTGLQGNWQSDEDIDYKLVSTGIAAPVLMTREGSSFKGYLNPAVGALAQGLAMAGHRTMVFLSSSKHYGFSVAKNMLGRPREHSLPADLDALLALAEAELGVQSQIRILVEKRIAVHSSAMIREEQRASELAFETGSADTIFATATLGQGLNLPASAVVIGGTDIGYDGQASQSQQSARAHTQFLNAIGRAGRAHVAARSLAIVVPNKAVMLDDTSSQRSLPWSTQFLKEDDASVEIESQLSNLIEAAIRGDVDFTSITPAESAAFAFLSFSGDINNAGQVLNRSYAAFRAGLLDTDNEVAATLGRIGSAYIQSIGAPEWIAVAAHRAGVTIPRAIVLHEAMRLLPLADGGPTTLMGWVDTLLAVLRQIPFNELESVLPSAPFKSTALEPVWQRGDRTNGWAAFRLALHRWISGQTYAAMSSPGLTGATTISNGRGAQDPIPRAIRMIDKGFSHELTMVAGALLAIAETALESQDIHAWQLTESSIAALERLPGSIRTGLDTEQSTAWFRLGFRPRRVAKLMEKHFPAPALLDTTRTADWVRDRARTLSVAEFQAVSDLGERRALEAALVLRNSELALSGTTSD